MLPYLTQRRRVGMGALVRVRVLEIVVAVTVARNYNNTADSGVRHLDQSVGDDRREDRASLVPLNAQDGVYMAFHQCPTCSRAFSLPGCLQVS